MEEFIKEIIRRKIPCYFISPHLDDAALSAGGIITEIASKTSVKIITIFTEGTKGPYTFVMKRFLKKCGYSNALELFVARREEEKKLFSSLPIEIIHLGFIDGSFRRKSIKIPRLIENSMPELTYVYPLGRKIFGIAKEDQSLKYHIKEKLLKIIPSDEQHIIFCPLGTVKHMDHQITTDVCFSIFPNLIFWRDYPYITVENYSNSFIRENHLQTFVWDKNLEDKKKLIEGYTSQLKGMFPDGKIPLIPETFYMSIRP